MNDMGAGVGKNALAAIGARLSGEARESGVRVCYYGFEFRKALRSVASARFKREIGRAYIAGKLEVPGMSPPPTPELPKGKPPRHPILPGEAVAEIVSRRGREVGAATLVVGSGRGQ